MKTRTTKYPEGITLVDTPDLAKKMEYAIRTAEKAKGVAGQFRLFFRKQETERTLQALNRRAKALRRANELSKEFRVVKLDRSLKTTAIGPRGKKVEVPLIFTSRLPAPVTKTFRNTRGYSTTVISAAVPTPPVEAINVLAKHGRRFDRTEVWWVPKDVKVTVSKRYADPIVVGAIGIPDQRGVKAEQMYFELYRWEQADVEYPYFAHEAY